MDQNCNMSLSIPGFVFIKFPIFEADLVLLNKLNRNVLDDFLWILYIKFKDLNTLGAINILTNIIIPELNIKHNVPIFLSELADEYKSITDNANKEILFNQLIYQIVLCIAYKNTEYNINIPIAPRKFKIWLRNNVIDHKYPQNKDDIALTTNQYKSIITQKTIYYEYTYMLEYIKSFTSEYVPKSHHFKFEPLPFDVSTIWPDDYIVSYQEYKISQYYPYWEYLYINKSNLQYLGRCLSYFISLHPDIDIITYIPQKSVDISLLPLCILNYPYIHNVLLGINTSIITFFDYIMIQYEPPITLTVGQLETIYRYIRNNKIKIRKRKDLNIPYCIEDYADITIHEIIEVTASITQNIYPQNPYDNMISKVLGEFKMFYNSYSSDPLILSQYDINILPDQLKFAYIQAKYGIVVTSLSDPDFRALSLYSSIIEAGGISTEKKDSRCFTTSFTRLYKNLPQNTASNTMKYLSIPLYDILTSAQFETIIRRGYVHPLPIDNIQYQKRAYQIHTLRPGIILTYINAYNLNINTFATTFTLKTDICQLFENIVNSYYNTPIYINSVITKLGLRPLTKASKYIKRSLQYLELLCLRLENGTQSITLDNMTDVEIIDKLNCKIGYTNRYELVTLAKILTGQIDGNTFFIPNDRNTCVSLNTTCISEPDININEVKVICYGSLINHIAYTFNEIKAGFSEYGNSREYRRLDISGQINKLHSLNMDEVKSLKSLLNYGICFEDEAFDASNTLDILNEMLLVKMAVSSGDIKDQELKYIYSNFTIQDQKSIITCLSDIFYIGMSFRRWAGSGPFPIEEVQSLEHKDFNQDTDTLSARIKFEEDFNMLSLTLQTFITKLPVVEHSINCIAKSKTPFGYYWHKLIGVHVLQDFEQKRKDGIIQSNLEGDICIRVASTLMIGTGHYYANLLANVSLGADNGYVPNILHKIQ